ncbi:MAG: hypothetical protein D6689_04115 [Deltaproteobacteria bacterium]|nr:MAG: hypothetical protein D6689_04115 [Deltaproteobacteria bacterium]
MLVVVVAACGGDDRPAGDCVPGSSQRYLPIAVGATWSYSVYAVDAPDVVTTKSQRITGTMPDPTDGVDVFVQETVKSTGRTVNWLAVDGDRVVRRRQLDYTPDGALERTTLYEPPRLRLDESPAHTAAGATFEVSYTEIELDPNGVEVDRRAITEQWVVLDADAPCPDAFADIDCLHVQRGQAGVPPKAFWFSRGIGKVREDGGQVEQLTACSLP